MRTFTVAHPARLLDYLFEVLADTKKTRVRQFLKFRSVSVNDRMTTRFDFPLSPGDRVSIRTGKEERPAAPPLYGVEIIYEDDAVIVIDKPSGLLTIATEKVATRTAFYAVNDYVNRSETQRLKSGAHRRDRQARKKQVFIVHRLDQDASGLMVFARSAEVKIALQSHWQDAVKKYYAVAEGVMREKTGTLTSYLRESKSLKVYTTDRAEGAKLSTTRYTLLRASAHYSLLEVELKTGRKHQIRVQLADAGHPLAGDRRYGSRTDPAGRLALHACHLAFRHPVSGRRMVFQTPLPQFVDRILKEDAQP